MSRRFGWVIFKADLQSQESELLRSFRGTLSPKSERRERGEDYVMRKVDDNLELCLAYGKDLTVIQGQFDLGVEPFEAVGSICSRYSAKCSAFWLSAEGVSESYMLKEYISGRLVWSYARSEGKELAGECFGDPPQKDEYGGIDEWGLVEEIEKKGILYESIAALEFKVLNYT